jgi:hypothetical protein
MPHRPGVSEAEISPPRLPWPAVLILSIVTLGIFEDVWLLRQAWWAKRADARSRAMIFVVAGLGLLILGGVLAEISEFTVAAGWIEVAGLVISQVGNFSVKGTMEKHYNISLSGLMTIFFTSIYFQYHFDRLAKSNVTSSGSSLRYSQPQ